MRLEGRVHRAGVLLPRRVSCAGNTRTTCPWTCSRSCCKDEEGHIDFIETQLDLLKSIGIQNYGQLQAASADKVEGHAD